MSPLTRRAAAAAAAAPAGAAELAVELMQHHRSTPTSARLNIGDPATAAADDDDGTTTTASSTTAGDDHMYFREVDSLISSLELTVAIQLNLLDSFSAVRNAYFLHIIIALVVFFFAMLSLKRTLQDWARVGSTPLRALWYGWVLRLSNLVITFLSVAVVQTLVQKFESYLRTNASWNAPTVARLVIVFALFAWVLQAYKFILDRPRLARQSLRSL